MTTSISDTWHRYRFVWGATAALALIAAACTTGGGGHPTWSKSFGADGHDEFFGAAAAGDQLVLAGAWNGGIEGAESRDGDLWAISLDGAGNVLWQRALGVRNVPGALEGAPPDIVDLAVDDDAIWLSGINGRGESMLLRTNLSGQFELSVDIAPHEPGRFEQPLAVSPTAGGAVTAIWAYDTIVKSESDGHPATPDIELYEVGRWRLRVARVDDDGTVRWARTLDELFEEREPQELVVTGMIDGGAVAALSLEDTMVVTRFGGDGSHLWTIERSGNDDAVGAVGLPDGSVVIYGRSVLFSANSRQGFATRLAPDGTEMWHEHYGDVDRIDAGALACPPAASSCHLAFAGVSFGNIIPPTGDAFRVQLDGQQQDIRRDTFWGYPESVSYDPTTDRYLFSAQRWSVFEATALDGDLNEVSVQPLSDTGVVAPEESLVDSRVGGPIYYYSRSRQLLRAYETDGAISFTVPFDATSPRREVGLSVLARPDGAVVTGRNAAGSAWGVRFDPFGNVDWQKDWHVPAGRQQQLAPAADGGFWLAAESQLIRMDARGEPQWRRYVRGNPEIYEAANGVLMIGSTVMLLNNEGSLEWTQAYTIDGAPSFLDHAHETERGWVFVSKRERTLALLEAREDGAPRAAFAVSASTGWFRGTPRVAVVDGLRVIATTYDTSDAETDVLLVALTAEGELAWVRRYGGLLRDEVRTLVAPESGGLVLGGASSSLGDVFDGWVLRLDSDGLVGVEGACQALLESPEVRIGTTDFGTRDWTEELYDAEPPTARVTSIASETPELAIARQCLGSAPDPEPDPDPGPMTEGFRIRVFVEGQEVTEGTILGYVDMTLRIEGPGDLSQYEFAWFFGPPENGLRIGDGSEITWFLESTATIHAVVTRAGTPITTVTRTIQFQR